MRRQLRELHRGVQARGGGEGHSPARARGSVRRHRIRPQGDGVRPPPAQHLQALVGGLCALARDARAGEAREGVAQAPREAVRSRGAALRRAARTGDGDLDHGDRQRRRHRQAAGGENALDARARLPPHRSVSGRVAGGTPDHRARRSFEAGFIGGLCRRDRPDAVSAELLYKVWRRFRRRRACEPAPLGAGCDGIDREPARGQRLAEGAAFRRGHAEFSGAAGVESLGGVSEDAPLFCRAVEVGLLILEPLPLFPVDKLSVCHA